MKHIPSSTSIFQLWRAHFQIPEHMNRSDDLVPDEYDANADEEVAISPLWLWVDCSA